MTASFEVDGANIKVTFEYTAPIEVVQSVVGNVAENLWVEETDEEGAVLNPFSEATNQDKLDVADAHVLRVLLETANSHKSQKAQTLARETEEANKYDIEEILP